MHVLQNEQFSSVFTVPMHKAEFKYRDGQLYIGLVKRADLSFKHEII
jgi:hypothetical protein